MERCPVSVASVGIMVAVVAVFGAEGPGAVGPVSRLVWWTRRAGQAVVAVSVLSCLNAARRSGAQGQRWWRRSLARRPCSSR